MSYARPRCPDPWLLSTCFVLTFHNQCLAYPRRFGLWDCRRRSALPLRPHVRLPVTASSASGAAFAIVLTAFAAFLTSLFLDRLGVFDSTRRSCFLKVFIAHHPRLPQYIWLN
ncbi:hypothetical protein PMIN06_009543 [Paraphaeosphaeria minitans]